MSKRTLITGITGQDGPYLAKFLLKKGYEVYGLFRRVSTRSFWRLQSLGVYDDINLIPGNINDTAALLEAVKRADPDEVFHLAAQSFVGASFESPISTGNTTGLGTTRLLEVLRHVKPEAKFYFAATSEMFGKAGAGNSKLSANDHFKPMSPYAAAKLYSHRITHIYREAYDIFAISGILFNHESPLRGLEFVTRKISNAVAKIKLGLQQELHLGNLNAKRDWGYAPEYVKAMWMMLQQEEPEDYVIASGVANSVREFVEKAFNIVDLDWQEHVETDKRFFRPLDVPCLKGDRSKAEEKLGWQPETSFEELVELMVEKDLERWKRWQNGEKFPWDAPNHPQERKVMSRTMGELEGE